MKLIASLIGAAALAALSLSAHAQAVKPDLGKGAASFGQVCAACHAADGNSVIGANPKLAGQHPEYLVKQLTEFKSGKRANAVMSGMAAALSDEDMRNIGFWLASQKPTPGTAKDKDLVFIEGATHGFTPCANCMNTGGAAAYSNSVKNLFDYVDGWASPRYRADARGR